MQGSLQETVVHHEITLFLPLLICFDLFHIRQL